MDRELIKKVQELRKNGKSFGEISKELLITKSNACYCNKINLEEYDEKKIIISEIRKSCMRISRKMY